MKYDVFISYSSSNSEIANAVCHMLEEQGIRCWIAPRNILPGRDYGDVIYDAILGSKIFIFIYSFESINSVWCKGELNVAFSENKIIIPYRIDATPMKGAVCVMLNQFHWLDASLNYKSQFTKLVETIYFTLGRDQQVPQNNNCRGDMDSYPENSMAVTTKTNELSKIIDVIRFSKQAFTSIIKIERHKRICNTKIVVIGRVVFGDVYWHSKLLLYSLEGKYQYAKIESFNNLSEMLMYSQIVYDSFNKIEPLGITDFYLKLYSMNGEDVGSSVKAHSGNYVGFILYNRSDNEISDIIEKSSHIYCI